MTAGTARLCTSNVMEVTTVVVTGAAGGIGSVVVDSLLAAGCRVVGLDLNVAVTAGREEDLYKGYVVDVTDAAGMRELARQLGPVEHLVGIAGGALDEEIAADGLVDPAVWESSLKLNLSGAYLFLHSFYPNLLAAHGNRSVTLVSSVNATKGFGLVAYSAAKAGMSGLMCSLLTPLGREGIRINLVSPGTTPTPRSLHEWAGNPEHFERMRAQIPLGRLGTPADVAAAVKAVALELTHVHGAELFVDGGQSKSR